MILAHTVLSAKLISVVDVKSRKELRRIKVGDGPWGVAIVSGAP